MSVLNLQRNVALGRALRCRFDLSNESFDSGMKIDAAGGPCVRATVDKESTATERSGSGHDVNGQSVIAPCCA
ncbi:MULTISPECIES: hypothetical protein [Burkholderia]|uniref:hypothetical protein n=1 Tax=Burkholderia TaxID=32008 RepID=UPI0013B3B1BF|nr:MULTISPECIES: hypothetical protein [Burkholderia]QTD94397.1 hypothetical protein J4G50_32060 [Burkholderia anthina]